MFERFKRKNEETPSAAPYPKTWGQFHRDRIHELVGVTLRGDGDIHTFEDANGNVFHSEVTKRGEELPAEYLRYIGEQLMEVHGQPIEYAGVTHDRDKMNSEIHTAVRLADRSVRDIIAARQPTGQLALF